MKILDELPGGTLKSDAAARTLLRWATAEREVWLDAVTEDPLLPERLLPPDYLGQTAGPRRVAVLRQGGSQLQNFTPG